MSQERLTMRKVSEVLRLKWECKLSNRAIARSCSISHSTVGEYLWRAQEAGLRCPLPADVGEDTHLDVLSQTNICPPPSLFQPFYIDQDTGTNDRDRANAFRQLGP